MVLEVWFVWKKRERLEHFRFLCAWAVVLSFILAITILNTWRGKSLGLFRLQISAIQRFICLGYARLRARERGRREGRKKGKAIWNLLVFQLFEVSCALLSLILWLRYYPSMLILVKARLNKFWRLWTYFHEGKILEMISLKLLP